MGGQWELKGRKEVGILVDDIKQPGLHEAEWNAAGLPSGIYLYRIITKEFTETRKMILMK
jgi:hypothetical protein